MALSEVFTQIFDKSKDKGHAALSTDLWVVKEHEMSATMKCLEVRAKGSFLGFDHDLVKGMPDITTKLSSKLEDKDCDGIAFLYDTNGKENIVFAELKSNFDIKKITDAFHQILMSFLKMHSWLSLCENYNLEDVIVHFVVACKCFRDENQESNVLQRISQAQQLGKNTFEAKFLNRLLKDKYIMESMSSFGDIQNLPFHNSIRNKEVCMHLQLTQSPSDSNTSMALK